jgi:4a-hydroxytetrahydrobiopterin dehydratase
MCHPPANYGFNPGGVSEQGWKEFLAAEGVEDWVVLHGGATAVFRVRSLGDAAHLAEAVANTPELAGRGILLTVADDRLTVRLSRDIWQLEPEHVQLARAISAVAREHGAILLARPSRKCNSQSQRS